MSIFSRVASVFQKKDFNIESKEDRIFWQGLGSFGSRNFISVAAALRAGKTIASGIGMMPVGLEGGENEKLSRLLSEGGQDDLLNPVEFREMLTLHAVHTGAGRALIRRRSSTGEPIEFIPLHPTWCQSGWVYEDGRYVLPVSVQNEGISGRFTRSDILEITSPRWDMLQGMNVTHACSDVLGLSRRLQERQARLSETSAPYGVMMLKEGAGRDGARRLKDAWAKQFGKSGIALVDMDGDFKQMMQTASDQQILETMQFQVEEVGRMYDVHPYFLMQTGGSGAQGAVADAMLFHQVQTMAPWINRWEAAIQFSLLRGTGIQANFDESVLMRTTPQVRAEIYSRALGSGGNKPWMTEDEVRSGKSPFNLPEMGKNYWANAQSGGSGETSDEV